MKRHRQWLAQLREDDKLVGISEIARRYFTMNAFDGVLTIIGILMGTYTAGVEEPRIVLITGLTTAFAMGISGLWGAYLTESAERERALDDLGRQTLTDLHPTRIGRASRSAIIIVSVVDGLSPILASVIVLLPFIFAPLLPTIDAAYLTSLILALVVLFLLGIMLGRISRGSIWIFGLKTLIAGILSIAISLLLGVA